MAVAVGGGEKEVLVVIHQRTYVSYGLNYMLLYTEAAFLLKIPVSSPSPSKPPPSFNPTLNPDVWFAPRQLLVKCLCQNFMKQILNRSVKPDAAQQHVEVWPQQHVEVWPQQHVEVWPQQHVEVWPPPSAAGVFTF
ncbi:unnamed protein product [Pleuronectes platessa]|uniref:Uncharacterized protein n=1 Tax=Pleuronectes platessa TaxID=8262 RepID=A0A9N7VZN7_PLEPL|nr:unnamed protein product [Pleuronectes platessa]